MKVLRFSVPILTALSVAACDNTAWSDGIFVGTGEALRVTVINEPGEEKRLRVEYGSSCEKTATISVKGNVMRVSTKYWAFSPCQLDNFLLTRVNDHTGRTIYNGQSLEMRKQ